jgi:hypothetical protein
LILCQQNLQTISSDNITQRIMNDFMDHLEDAIKQETSLGGHWLRRKAKLILEAFLPTIIILLALGLLLFWLFSPSSSKSQGNTFYTGLGAFGLLILGVVHSAFVWSKANIFNRLSGVLNAAGPALIEAYEQGYKQIRIEFKQLDYFVSASKPLIEFYMSFPSIAANPTTKPTSTVVTKDDYDFLTEVIWTKADYEIEIERVASAAFGPIGIFVLGSITQRKKK